MTLIATAISRHGIVLAADARFTSRPEHVVAGPRLFRLGFHDVVLSITGGYAIGGRPLNEWMGAAIAEYEREADQPSMRGFVEQLRDRLTRLRDPIQRRAIHVAGYVGDGRRAHAEVYYLRNIHGRARDGGYGRARREFIVSEEFWTRDFSEDETRDALGEGGARMYLDGFPSKRIAYMLLHKRIHDFYGQVWRSSSKMFRSPHSLEDIASLVELDMRIAAAFLISPSVGWPRSKVGLEVELIPAPPSAIG